MDYRLDQLKVGDVLSVVGELDQLIVDKIWLSTQGSYRWVDYETTTRRGRQRLILSVEYDDGEWETVLYDSFPAAHELPGAESLPATLLWNGKSYGREERGRCRMQLMSAPGEPLDCQYADYSASDGTTLAVEVFGDPSSLEQPGEVELFVGRVVPPGQVQVFAPIDLEERQGFIMSAPSKSGPGAARGEPSRPALLSTPVIVAAALVLVALVIILALR